MKKLILLIAILSINIFSNTTELDRINNTKNTFFKACDTVNIENMTKANGVINLTLQGTTYKIKDEFNTPIQNAGTKLSVLDCARFKKNLIVE